MALLSIILIIPAVAMLLTSMLPYNAKSAFRISLVGIPFIQFILSLFIYLNLEDISGYQFIEQMDWINLKIGNYGIIKIDYLLGVDGPSALLLLLSSFILLIAGVMSLKVSEKLKGYVVLFQLLALTIPGCFIALDAFLFFIFFEFMLLPMFFLIGIWGGKRREYASIKFFIYTLLGSILILFGLITLNISNLDPASSVGIPVHTFNLIYLENLSNIATGSILDIENANFRDYVFISFLIGFLIKLPSFPFHTWLPDAHVEASTPISVILAGILLKIGGYGIFRFAFGLFPDIAIDYTFWIGLLGLISILYGGLNAMAMQDIKKLIAYSSISHMGFVLLGFASLTKEGINGALFQLYSHGIISAGLFILAGVIYKRTGDRNIDSYRGLASKMPNYTVCVTLLFFASLGLPGFSGFIAEFFVLLGAFFSEGFSNAIPRYFAIISLASLVITASYYLWTIQRMFFGKFSTSSNINQDVLIDLDFTEKAVLLTIIIISLVTGLFPSLIMDSFSEWTNVFVDKFVK